MSRSLRRTSSATAFAMLLTLMLAPAASAQDSGTAVEVAEPTNDTAGFEEAMVGQWVGGGEVIPNLSEERPYTVKCEFTSEAEDGAFDLDGECGVLFIKRGITVSLQRDGDTVTGTYDANLRTGLATLTGDYHPDSMDLNITWGGDVNGDTEAAMRIERADADTLRIMVTDVDPATNEDVVTSDLTLTREG